MRLTRLQLTDIGRHASLDVDLDSPVAGIVGPNGSGKTTIIQIMRTAMTGETPEGSVLTDFVRFFGQEDGAANGTVTLHFRKNGKEGKIFRQIGKTSKRELHWEGEKITKAAEFDACMAEITGASAHAINAAIFIQQAELDKLLFGGQAEREELFVRLLCLSHMEKVSAAAAQKVALLRRDIQDYDQILDTLKQQHSALAGELVTLSAVPDNGAGAALDVARRWSSTQREMTNAVATAERLRGELRDIEARQKATVAQLLGGKDVGALDGEIAQMEARADQLAASIAAAEATNRTFHELTELLARRQATEENLNAVNRGIFEIGDVASALQGAQADVDKRAALDNLTREIERTELSIAAIGDPVAHVARLEPLDKQIAEKEASLSELTAEFNRAEMVWKLTSAVLSSGCADMSTCPVCQHSMENVKFSQQDVDAAKSALDSAFAKVTDARQDLTRLCEQSNRLRNEMADAINQLGQLREQLRIKVEQRQPLLALGLKPGAVYADAALAARAQQAQLLQLQAQDASLQQDLGRINARLIQIPVTTQLVVNTSKDQAEAAANRTELANLRTVRQQVQHVIRDAATKAGELANAEVVLKSVTATEEKIRQQEFTMLLTNALQNNNDNISAVVEVLTRQHQENQERVGRISELANQKTRVQSEIDSYAARQAQDVVRRSLIADLELLQAAFARRGLPLKYIRMRYEQLIELTRSNLSKMEADFTVFSDPDNAVSMLFTRSNESQDHQLAQNLLSGGQRVRVSVAFLLAVQQLVLPEVGLLVLDEPSNHLDEDGRAQLAEFVRSLADTLRNTDSQVIVCDHCAELATVFGKTLTLKN